mmetsp:Transcript_40183/g.124160  ORF Transcript_40183/g.124160 Transcript_40183/m.124160 type:complete len:280 (+) Transcript_40183:332-1171(+)
MNSRCPGNCRIDHEICSRSGWYLTCPKLAFACGVSASHGTGTQISTAFAVLLFLNVDRALTSISTRDEPCRCVETSTWIRGRTFWFRRYVISSKLPSGGMKVIVRSLSKRLRRTHWWNLRSSRSTAFPRPPAAAATAPRAAAWLLNRTRSFRPRWTSGIPESCTFIFKQPEMSDCKVSPSAPTRRLTVSMTSRNTSFLRCLMPGCRQPHAPLTPVTACGSALTAICSCADSPVARLRRPARLEDATEASLNPCCVTYSFRILPSVYCGNPKSIISSRSS